MNHEKIVFIAHPYYAVNNPKNNYRIYLKNRKTDKWYYIKCKDKNDYSKKVKEYVCGFFDYSRDEDKAHSSMFDYFMGSKKETNVLEENKMKREEMAMLKDGSFIKDDMVNSMKKNWNKYIDNSNCQLAVLSLYQDYVDENININDLQKELTTSILPKLFNYCGYQDPKKNLEWVVSLHSDRENNYHFHIAWIEKNKCYKYRNNKLGYRTKLHLTEKENNFLKRQVSLSIERANLYKPALIQLNKNFEQLQSYFNPKDKNFTLKNIKYLDVENDIARLGYLLSQVRDTNKKYIKYNSLPRNEIGNEIRMLTKEIKRNLINGNINIKMSKNEINKSIERINDIFIEIDKKNNITDVGFESAFDNKMIKEKLEKSDNYILNAIVNHALYSYDKKKKEKIKYEDLIVNAAIVLYRKNYKSNYNLNKIKLKSLKNYLTYGKYENISELSRTLKRLSQSSDKAAEEFYKMFSDELEIK